MGPGVNTSKILFKQLSDKHQLTLKHNNNTVKHCHNSEYKSVNCCNSEGSDSLQYHTE